MKTQSYSTDEFPFKKLIESYLNVLDLSNLQQNNNTEILFNKFIKSDVFLDVYKQFIKKYVSVLYDSQLAHQIYPVGRIVYKDKLNMYKFHKDKWYRKNTIYSDIQIENIFLPFTNAFDSNSIWVESQEDKYDFTSIKCDYGQFVHWDGNNLLHGNVINKSGNSRVSIDFRVYKYENLLHPEYTLLNF